jgi:putative flippase GtrA
VKFLPQIQQFILSKINFFYQPFKKLIPEETFRYAVTGGTNTSLDIFLYFISYNFILQKQVVNLRIVSISPYIASFLMVFPVTFVTGFLLSKYITFTESVLRGRQQLVRYGITVFVCFCLNYIFIKFFVEVCGLYPTPAKIATTVLVIIYSFFSQKYFTFKKKV